MAPPNSDNFDMDFIQNVFDEDTANLLSLAELPFHIPPQLIASHQLIEPHQLTAQPRHPP